ncbi:MAG: four helix bundle protein [Bacteroidetes bacterium 4572_112]|nr:MAG: four helix bundle protein [Bacteroidetes bacterium 4572_112]
MINTGNAIVDLSFSFALEIIKLSEELDKQRKYVIGKQILRSGTSIGANIRESQQAESKADFIHKLKIASKEIDETEYWLLLCKYSENCPDTDYLIPKIIELKRVIGKIISTSKKKQ